MKKTFYLILGVFSLLSSSAQQALLIKHEGNNHFLIHKVMPKDNFYSVGRLYNAPPKEIAAANSLDMTKGLTIGQTIKIPLNSKNFNQTSASGVPVYYEVQQNEGLFRVSSNNNKVLMASLRKWNNLTSDGIAPGQKLIVGFLKTSQPSMIPSSDFDQTATSTPATQSTKQQKIQPSEKTASVTDMHPQQDQSNTIQTITKTDTRGPNSSTSSKTTSNPAPVNDGNGGFFHTQFLQQIKTQPLKSDITATAGIFKTTSGWADAKYYALLDRVEPGTIIRITNPSNNKSVYAKVLGEMGTIRQNQGFDIRISNAAAAALNILEQDKFILKISY